MTRFSVPVLLLCAVPVSAAPVPERVPELVKALKNGKPGERVIAAEALGDLGPKAEGAISGLVEVIRDTPTPVPTLGETRWSREESAANFLLVASWDALERIGPKAVPALIDLFAHRDVESRGRAAAALKAIGPAAADAVPALIKRLDEGENQWVCLNALGALAAIGPKAEAAVPALIKTVLDPKATVPPKTPLSVFSQWGPYWIYQLPLRRAAARALAAIGPKALPAVKKDLFPAVIRALDEAGRDRTFLPGFGSGHASPVWAPFGADAAPLVPALARYLNRHNESRLVLSLLELGPEGQKALAGWFSDKDEQVREEQFNVFCKHATGFFVSEEGAHCRGAVADLRPIAPQLIPFLTDKDFNIRLQALETINRGCFTVPPEAVKAALPLLDDKEFLKRLDESDTEPFVGVCGPAAIPKLLEHLKSDDKKLRAFAARALKGLRGPGAEALLPMLRELATGKTQNPEITPCGAARMAILISFDPKDVELLVPYAKSNDPKDRIATVFQLRGLGHLARPHLKPMIALLKDPDDAVRRNAARRIDEIAPSDPDACAALAQLIVDYGAPIPLWGTDPLAKEIAPAVPVVLKMLERGRGFGLVRRIGPPAKDAVPLLLPYLTRDPDPDMPNGADRIEPQDVLGALGAIGPAAKDAVPLIRKRLVKAGDWEKMWCLLCLADIGPGAKAAVPELKELLIDPDPRLRLLAACALSKIEADPAAYRATFVRAIHERPNCAFWDVPLVLDRIAADCPELVPVVVRGIIPRSNEAHLVWGGEPEYPTVMPILMRNASLAKGAVLDLVNYLNKPPARAVRPEFVELLGAIGPDANAALPKLRELRDGPDFDLATAAQEAIQKIEAKK